MTRARVALGPGVLAILGALAGIRCGTVNVPVAEMNAPASTAQACTTASDCPTGKFCDMPSCSAPPDAGTCQTIPSDCSDAGQQFRCGCDGLVYWNDCVRQQRGAPVGQDCTAMSQPPLQCDRDRLPCPADSGAKCEELLFGGCDLMAQSDGGFPVTMMPFTCWVLPEPCPPDTPDAADILYSTCDPSLRCKPLCMAIANEKPFEVAAVPPFQSRCQ